MNFIARALLAGMTVALAAGSLFRTRGRPARRRRPGELTDEALRTGDGALLPLTVWRPAGDPVAALIALHTFADYRKAFEVSAPYLAERGIVVHAYDQRGFGGSASRGTWPPTEDLVRDLEDAVQAVRSASPGLPLIVLGEGMGGAVALCAASRMAAGRPDALILAAPGVRGDLPQRQLQDLALRLAALALPWLAVEIRRGGRPWLLPEEAARLGEDPLILRELSVGTYEGLVDLATRASDSARSDFPPTLVLHGDLDTTIPDAPVRQLVARLGSSGRLMSYSDRHHLLLHEEGFGEVLDDCLAWLEEALSAPAAAQPATGAQAAAIDAPEGRGPAAAGAAGPAPAEAEPRAAE